jgi:Bacterial DNA polymerase III alpha subunit finger domain
MDIDIDFQTTFDPRRLMKQAVPASMVKNNDLVKHPCGHYFQTIPVDERTGLAAIPYEEAEVLGYFKIDFLHLSLLDNFHSKTQIRELLTQEPDWSILQDPDQVPKLFQIHKHEKLLRRVKPTTVQELADCIALIRPGKRHLVDEYVNNKEKVRKALYVKDESGYYFKRSHAISYALTIVLQLHLISQGVL